MKTRDKQYEKTKPLLPKQRGNVAIENKTFINAMLYICENGCKWRGLPTEFGYWRVIYKRYNRWVKAGVIDTLFRELHVQNILKVNPEALFLDSTTVKAHPDACGALKKRKPSNRTFQRRTNQKDTSYVGNQQNRRGIYPKRRPTS